ncbi:MAG: uroporphyrinogen decarboxylase family protein [Thermofilaceae archaeon]
MQPRERCIRAIEHEVPDRVPLDFNCRPEPLAELLKTTGCESFERLLRALNIDVRGTGCALKGGFKPPATAKPAREWVYGPTWVVGREGEFEVAVNIWGVEVIFSPRAYTYTYRRHPLQRVELEEYPWPELDEEETQRLVSHARRVYGDYLLVAGVEHLWENAWQLTGFNEAFRMMLRDPAKFERILDGIDRIRVEEAKLLCDLGVDVIYDGDDVGMQKGMMMSPQLWRRYFKPRYKRLIDEVHRRGAFFMFHSDGWIEPIIPDLVEIGVDILNPVQPECMDPYRVKELYGDELALHGTVSVQTTLLFATPLEVEELVRERVSRLGPEGFILAPTHAIQPGTPVDNVLAMYRAALRYGRYR